MTLLQATSPSAADATVRDVVHPSSHAPHTPEAAEHALRDRVARVVAAIVADPAAPHRLDTLAALAHYSPYHFHRVYQAVTGETVAETVRRVRLVGAARRLADGASVTDAALDAGYEHPGSFTRAFRDLVELSPSAFREHMAALGEGDDASSDLRLVDVAPRRLRGLRHDGPASTIPHVWMRLHRALGPDPACWRGAVLGVTFPPAADTLDDPNQPIDYLAGVVDDGAPFAWPDGFESIELPGGRCLAWRLVGPWTRIHSAFATLYARVLPRLGLEPDDRPVVEDYLDPGDEATGRPPTTDLLVPVRGGRA